MAIEVSQNKEIFGEKKGVGSAIYRSINIKKRE